MIPPDGSFLPVVTHFNVRMTFGAGKILVTTTLLQLLTSKPNLPSDIQFERIEWLFTECETAA